MQISASECVSLGVRFVDRRGVSGREEGELDEYHETYALE